MTDEKQTADSVSAGQAAEKAEAEKAASEKAAADRTAAEQAAKLASKAENESGHLTPKHVRMMFAAFVVYVFFMGGFLLLSCIGLINDKKAEEGYWESALTPDAQTEAETEEIDRSASPVMVTVGTYITDLKDMNLDDSDFEVVAEVWFRWSGSPDLDMAHHFGVYKGSVNKLTVIEETHNGNENYQLAALDTTISKAFWTVRFPLESHQLRMYLQSSYDINDVRFTADREASTVNPNLEVAGFKLLRSDTTALDYRYESSLGNPDAVSDTGHLYIAEHLTQIEINRTGFSLYLMCFIAMFGTMIWAMITLFICTYHRVDPLGMIPGALFGTVANIMVGANKVPSMQQGLLLEMNFFGIATILTTAITIIMINRIRSKYEDRAFAKKFGRMMFFTEVTLVFIGNIALPVSAYKF